MAIGEKQVNEETCALRFTFCKSLRCGAASALLTRQGDLYCFFFIIYYFLAAFVFRHAGVECKVRSEKMNGGMKIHYTVKSR